jgi:hypothetical protein
VRALRSTGDLCIKALLRLYQGSIKALLRLYEVYALQVEVEVDASSEVDKRPVY